MPKPTLQAATFTLDMKGRSMATAIMIQKALWLQASGIPKEMKVTKEDLLFSRWSYLVNTWIVLYIS